MHTSPSPLLMESPPPQAVSGDQRTRLLELEERQRLLKRLCEEALKEEEQHEHIFQQLQEHTTAAMSTTESFAVNGGADLSEPPLSHSARAEPLDDLLTGEVQSFRDPNSIARASSTGSAAAAPGSRVGSLPHPHNLSVDPPRSRLNNRYRPPTCPLPGTSTTQPPPPPRAMLYSTSRKPLEEGSWSAAAAAHRSTQPSTSPPVIPPYVPAAHTTWQGEESIADIKLESNSLTAADKPATRVGSGYDTHATATAGCPPAAHTPLPPPPPPPPPPARSRSHSTTLSDRHRRSATRTRHGIPPPPPNPPSQNATDAPASSFSRRYSQSLGTRTGLEPPTAASPPLPPPPPSPPSRSTAPYLVSPAEATENILPPSPHTLSCVSAHCDVQPSMIGSFRKPCRSLNADLLPPPPPPPAPAPRTAHTYLDDSSILSTSSTKRDVARWTRQSSVSEAFWRRDGRGDGNGYDISKTAGLTERRTPRASAAPRLSAPYRESTTTEGDKLLSRKARSSPPPAVSGTTFLTSPARYNEDGNESESLRNRWETVSLTSSLRNAEERQLRKYFAKPDREAGSTAPELKKHVSYKDQRARGPRIGVNNTLARPFESGGRAKPPLQQRSSAIPPPAPFTSSAPIVADVAPPPPLKPEPKMTAPHPYGPEHPQTYSFSSPPEPRLMCTAAKSSHNAPEHRCGAPAPPLSASRAMHLQNPSVSLGNWNRNSGWADGSTSPLVQSDVGDAAPTPAPRTASAVSVDDYFDVGPEKEALLSLMRESTRSAQESRVNVAPSGEVQRGEKALPYPPSTSSLSGHDDTQSFVAPLTTTSMLPPHYSAPKKHHSYTKPSADTELQQKCEAAQAKTETLARHLVKAISDRKILKDNVEQLELLVEECNAEVGRLQRVVEEQHQDSATSLGVQAALRAKEREVAVYEDEIRRLNGVLDGYLTRTAASKRAVEDSVHNGLVAKEAEVEAAMEEVGLAHLAQREAEERANQLANELDTAVEQIQFLDERLAEMERAVAAARFHAIPPGIVREQVMNVDNDDDNGANTALSHASAAARLAVPPTNEMRHWPPEARQAVLQLAAQAEELLLQNAEGERHASMRLQYVEKTCSELQQHLVQRSEEVERARETCQQLRQEKSALQTVGDQWFQQLRQVKEDAQLVSEMVCTAREDAEDVYLSSRVAAERAMEHQAARAAASPLRPLPSPSPMDPATLEKTARFAQQVMHDFQAMARFLASLRTMNIGDRNGYQILQIIASGHSPAEGLYVTADDDATPMRLRERLSSNAASETRRRVQDRKARVLRAVEQALTIEPDSAPGFLSLAAPANRPSNDATIMMGLPPRSGKKPSTMETEACEVPDALEDAVGNEDEVEVEVALASLHPSQTGSKSIRDGSSGIVHSDVRRRPAHDLALFLPHHQASRTSESSSATPTFAASMPSIPLTPTGNVTFSTVSTSQPRTAKPTEALTTPPPSVSRPLRLSTTPSQPQSDGKQDNPEGEAPPSDRHSSPTRTSSHIALATDSTLIRRSGAGVDPDMSSIKIVPSPSMSPQMFQQQTETQKQAPRPHESMRETQASIPLLHSRLRSPTPDQLPAMSLEIDTNVALITNPIEQLRTPELFVDEPLPRLGSEEYRQPVHLGSQPKDRSTTARPSSTPHPGPHSVTRRSHKAGDGEESAAPLRQGDRRRRDASNDSNEDEATLFFRDPPRGEVQEVTSKPTPASPKGQHSQVKVDLLRDDLLMSSRKTLAEATTSAPASSLSSQRSSVVEEEADVEERDPCAGAPAAPLSLSHQSSLKQSHTAASPRSRSVDDNEPSLSFSAPPPPMRLSYSQGHPEKAAEDETLPRKSLSDEALSGIDHLRAIPGTGDTAVVSHSALPSPSAKSSSFVDSLEWGSHQPRRIPALDSGPCLTGLAGAVAAPPRLQRSAGSSSSPAAQPPLCTTIPEPTAAIGAAVGLRRHSCGGSEPAMASVSLDRPLLDVTPALVEPRRPSLSARSEPAATLKNAVTARGPVDSAVAVSARPSTPVEQTLPLSKGGKASRSTSEVVIHVDDVDLLRSDSKITANTSSSTPAHRLPSITSTATPGSPLRAMERSHEAFGLPGVICDDKPENLGSSHSFPAELPQAVLEHPRELPSRAGRKTAPHSGPREGAAPAPLPAVNVDTPESNTLNLRHDSPPPASLMGETATTDRGRSPSSPAVAVEPSPMTSTPRSAVTSQDGQPGMPNSTLTERGVPDDAAARRREDVANILKRIRAKKEQEKKQCFEMDAPASPTASEGSVAIPKEVNSPT